MTASAFRIRFSTCYALLMIGSGIQLPFLPLWLHAKGLNVSQIAAVVAALMVVRIVGAPVFAFLADHLRNRRIVIQGCALTALLAYLILPFTTGFVQILSVGMIAALFFAPVFPLIEGFSVEGSSAHGLDYGRLRLWASLSFLVGSLLSGALLTKLSALDTIWLIAGAQVLAVIATLMLPPEPPVPAAHHATRIEFGEAVSFLFNSRFTVFLLAASLSNCSHGMLYSFSSVYWASLGFNTMTIGILWACGIIGEVGLFAFSNKIVHHLGVERLLCVGLAGGMVRWTGTALVTSEAGMMAVQFLHALSFACGHLALMHFIRLNVPMPLRNTAQGLYTALAGGVLLSSVTWISGPLFAAFGGWAFLTMAVISATGLVLAVGYIRANPKAVHQLAT